MQKVGFSSYLKLSNQELNANAQVNLFLRRGERKDFDE